MEMHFVTFCPVSWKHLEKGDLLFVSYLYNILVGNYNNCINVICVWCRSCCKVEKKIDYK